MTIRLNQARPPALAHDMTEQLAPPCGPRAGIRIRLCIFILPIPCSCLPHSVVPSSLAIWPQFYYYMILPACSRCSINIPSESPDGALRSLLPVSCEYLADFDVQPLFFSIGRRFGPHFELELMHLRIKLRSSSCIHSRACSSSALGS